MRYTNLLFTYLLTYFICFDRILHILQCCISSRSLGWDIVLLLLLSRQGRVIDNVYAPGNGSIWLDVKCDGNEESIRDCSHQPWGENDCLHSEDVFIDCNKEEPTIGNINNSGSSGSGSGSDSGSTAPLLRRWHPAACECRGEWCELGLSMSGVLRDWHPRLQWCARRRLQLNPEKTELIWFGSCANLDRLQAMDTTIVLMHGVAFGYAPTYLLDATVPVSALSGRAHLRSADSGCFGVPRVSSSVGSRAFSVAGLQAWNRLPVALRLTDCVASFKRQLKTVLFMEAYCVCQ